MAAFPTASTTTMVPSEKGLESLHQPHRPSHRRRACPPRVPWRPQNSYARRLKNHDAAGQKRSCGHSESSPDAAGACDAAAQTLEKFMTSTTAQRRAQGEQSMNRSPPTAHGTKANAANIPAPRRPLTVATCLYIICVRI